MSHFATIALLCATAGIHAGPVAAGSAGFVVSHIEYALSKDAGETNACPNGMVQGYRSKADVFVNQPALEQRDEEAKEAHLRRLFDAAFGNTRIENLCMNPELGRPDEQFYTVQGSGLSADGIDIDGIASSADDPANAAICPHDDFHGWNGETGIDNQFYRVVGCSASFQSTGQSNTFAIEMLTGSWGIVITLEDVENMVNDDTVAVGFFANADPIQLSADREVLAHASYAIHPDSRFHARTTGSIRDGVLVTDPVDLRFEYVVNTIRVDRPLMQAKAHLKLTKGGGLDGYLAGYTRVEDVYDFKYAFRRGRNDAGELASYRLRAGSSIGQAFVLGHTCEGAYYALHEHADAYPDPETGECTAISTQYRIQAVPAFVFDDVQPEAGNAT